MFTEFGAKVINTGHGKKPFGFGGNPDHVTLGLGRGYRFGYKVGAARRTILGDTGFVGEGRVIPRNTGYVLFHAD